ncbi:unnamed protein product [Owenia fusiformis]|uniref:Uncharacterized protein n=1 Tax=Owenia fusiformis TaxID=6347 RepID=A0A8J1TWW8_OWEFU|nr:unnamed protein product [Owenia fusiformis]
MAPIKQPKRDSNLWHISSKEQGEDINLQISVLCKATFCLLVIRISGNISGKMGETVKLNVGGTVMETSTENLEKLGLSALLSQKASNDGAIFIDQDSNMFKVLLTWARVGVLEVPEGVMTVKQLVAMAKSLKVNEDVMHAINDHANHINSKQYIKEIENRLDYDMKDDIKDPHVDLAHHNIIEIEHKFLRRDCKDTRFWNMVNISCIRHFSHIRDTPDIMTHFKGCKNKIFVYKYEMKNMSVECKICRREFPIEPNLGWCHKCQKCVSCQNNTLCVSPESFNRIDEPYSLS